MATPFEQLRALVAHDDLDVAVEQLAARARGWSSTAYQETLVQAGRLSRLRKEERRGFVSREETARERARIADALLQLLDEVERQTTPSERPFSTPAVSLTPPPDAALEKIIGANNLKSIAWLQRGLDAARSVCRVVTPRGLGTGFLIGDHWLMTNHHVLDRPATVAASFAEFNFQEGPTGQLEPFFRYPLSSDAMASDPELDFTLVQVLPSPSLPALASWGLLPLESGRTPDVGEHVSIIQHPGGGPKQIAVTANQVVNLFNHRLQYTTDTLPGSSGSPVFNDDWRVVALHHKGGNLVSNERGDRMFANEGILLSAILKHLGDRAPAVLRPTP